MHRRLQFGMRETPASDRRHGSRLVATIDTSSSSIEEEKTRPPNDFALAEPVSVDGHPVAHAAEPLAATGEEECVLAAETHARDSRRDDAAARNVFEPLIGSVQAARLLGNVHVKTLQRYARLGRLPGYQVGGHWYFRESELDAWLRNQINSNRQSVR